MLLQLRVHEGAGNGLHAVELEMLRNLRRQYAGEKRPGLLRVPEEAFEEAVVAVDGHARMLTEYDPGKK